MQIEFPFTLPRGYLDAEGNLHRDGVMRLANAFDEIGPMKDPRVQANPGYLVIILMSRGDREAWRRDPYQSEDGRVPVLRGSRLLAGFFAESITTGTIVCRSVVRIVKRNSTWRLQARGGSELPLGGAARGSSLHRTPFSLAV